MASDQVEMYQIANSEQSNGQENVILRALVGNPNRHIPQAQHPPPTTDVSQKDTPASMYTLETRYQPIPQKVLPNQTEPRLYYIEPAKAEQPSPPNSSAAKEEQDTPLPAESKPRNVEVEQDIAPMIFLEPKVISQPVLYSIVGEKNQPIQNNQPISTNKEMPSPLFYAITGQPRRITADMSTSTPNVETPVTNRSPTLYSLVGSPRLQPQMQEPTKQVVSVSQQPSPSLFSIVGGPTLTPNIPQTNTRQPPPSTQPVKVSLVEPVPILFTIVGESRVPNNIPKENRPPPAPVKKPTTEVILYTTVGDPNISQTVTLPRKPVTQTPKKQEPQQQTEPSALFSLVGKPTSPPEKCLDTPPKPIIRTRTPPAVLLPTRRICRSLDRRTAPDTVTEKDNSIPQIKRPRQGKSKEPTIPKSHTTFIPLSEYERSPNSRRPGPNPRRLSPGELQHNPYNIPQYDPLRLPDYISPYAYHPTKPYLKQTYNPVRLPALTNNRHSGDRKHPYDSRTHHSLERDASIRKERSRLWDYEDGTQTDIDDDDDNDGTSESRSNKKNQGNRRIRPRTPWIPVW